MCGIVCECREVGGTIAQSIKHLPLGHKDLSPHTKAGHGVGIWEGGSPELGLSR